MWVRRCTCSSSWLAPSRDATANGGGHGTVDMLMCLACLLLPYTPDDQMFQMFVHDILSCVVSHSPPWPFLAAVVVVNVVVIVVVVVVIVRSLLVAGAAVHHLLDDSSASPAPWQTIPTPVMPLRLHLRAVPE